jgi:hypothetical protein
MLAFARKKRLVGHVLYFLPGQSTNRYSRGRSLRGLVFTTDNIIVSCFGALAGAVPPYTLCVATYPASEPQFLPVHPEF